jgi:hypothetical protein
MYSPRRASGALLPVLLSGLAAAAPLVFTQTATLHAAVLPSAAQQGEDAAPAASSQLTGIKLPAGAVRITDEKMISTGQGQLKRIAGAGRLSVGKTEHLAWGGEGHDADRAETVKKRLVAALEADGYKVKGAGQKKVDGGTMTFFLAVHPKKNQGVLGIWMENDSFLILNWGEISKANKNADDDKEPAAPSDNEPAGDGSDSAA